jgi:hypothetical protein
MVNYTCNICGHVFKQKCHFSDHKNRKYPCKNQSSIIEVQEELKKTIKLVNKLKKENKMLKNDKITTNITGDNNLNNVKIINNNTINNNINVIQIIDHGKEDYSKIDIEKIMLENPHLPPLNYISTVIYNVHCSEKYPEYQNIYISDINRNKVIAYEDGKWVNKDKNNTIEKLFNNITNCVDTVTENTNNPNKIANYSNEIQKINPFGRLYTKKNRNTALSNSQNVLYDNKDKIKATKIKETKIKETKIKVIKNEKLEIKNK